MSNESTNQGTPPPAPPEPPLVKPDAVTEHEVAALVGILIKTVEIDRRLAANRKNVEEINKEIAADTLIRARGVNALNVFGFDSSQAKVWTAVREVIGQDAYQHGLDVGNGKIDAKKAEPPKQPLVNAMLAEAVEAFRSSQPLKTENAARPKIADAILAFMRDRGKAGVKASEVRRHLKSDYGIDTHEKTPGMTLYRLSKEGLVRREGRTWFPVDTAKDVTAVKNTATGQ
ncbi:MAG: hypothetical protein M3R41_08435 [Pseudomonadota bacterium]|nr:hypothetical protein [Pseudomonadota bacterium]